MFQCPAPLAAIFLLAAGFRQQATLAHVTWRVLHQFALVVQAYRVVQTPQ